MLTPLAVRRPKFTSTSPLLRPGCGTWHGVRLTTATTSANGLGHSTAWSAQASLEAPLECVGTVPGMSYLGGSAGLQAILPPLDGLEQQCDKLVRSLIPVDGRHIPSSCPREDISMGTADRLRDDPLLALGYSESEALIIAEVVSRIPPLTSEERTRVAELLPAVKGPQRRTGPASPR
jgi:hypothetical protein